MARYSDRLSNQQAGYLREHCQHFSGLGWALFAQMAAMIGVQWAVLLPVQLLAPPMLHSPVFLWGLSVASCYGVGAPLFFLLARRQPVPPPEGRPAPLRPGRFLQVYVIGLSAMYLVNLATQWLMALVGFLRGEAVVNPVLETAGYPVALNLLLGCVIAPVAEELMFRRVLLERLRPYGERFAALASALCFALFHGNFHQFFYAFALGVVFAYVVLKTRCLWQVVLLHAMVNGIYAGLTPLAERAGAWGAAALGLFILAAVVLGLVFFLVLRRRIWWRMGGTDLSEGRIWALFFHNPGVIFFCLLAAALAATYLAA